MRKNFYSSSLATRLYQGIADIFWQARVEFQNRVAAAKKFRNDGVFSSLQLRGLIVILFFALAACNQMGPLDRYSVEVNRYRDRKDSLFKFNAEQSPLLNDSRRYFNQLTYYAPDSTYRVMADYQKIPNPDTCIMLGTHNDKRPFLRVGVLYFKIKGKDYKLIAYQSVRKAGESLQSNELFVPFYDETNKSETHGSGRYLDIAYNGQDKLTLDFNYAYNPYCEYNNGFTCPITPFENRLPIRIEAGEKRLKL